MREVILSEVCKIKTGKTPPTKEKKYFNGKINWYTPTDLDKNKILTLSNRTITKKAFIDKKAVIFDKNVLLMTCIGDIGKTGITSEKCSSNQQITALIPNSNLDVNYLFYTIKYKKKYLNNIANNAVVPILNNRNLSQLKIPLPPLATQKKIAAILDEADKLRTLNKALLQKYAQLTQSLFLDMFGDPVLNPMGWEKVKFSEVGKLDRGKSKHRPRNSPELLGGNYPLVQTGDIANSGGYITKYKSTYSEIGLAQSRMWKKGTLCITIAANIAKTGILTFDACFPDSVVGFIPNEKTNNIFTQYWMSFLQKIIEESAPESAQKNINLSILRALDFLIPPIQLQNEFAARIKIIDAQKEQAQKALEQSDNLFNSLLQKAFKGELV